MNDRQTMELNIRASSYAQAEVSALSRLPEGRRPAGVDVTWLGEFGIDRVATEMQFDVDLLGRYAFRVRLAHLPADTLIA
jgi:hypothetical protein